MRKIKLFKGIYISMIEAEVNCFLDTIQSVNDIKITEMKKDDDIESSIIILIDYNEQDEDN